MTMRDLATTVVCMSTGLLASGPVAAQAPRDNCVGLGTPKPGVEYRYRLADSRGTTSDFTSVWEEVTPTSSRVRTTPARGGAIEYVSRYRIVNDVSVIEETVQSNAGTTTFSPGVVGDPFGRACANR